MDQQAARERELHKRLAEMEEQRLEEVEHYWLVQVRHFQTLQDTIGHYRVILWLLRALQALHYRLLRTNTSRQLRHYRII